jgi:hypothetical protein
MQETALTPTELLDHRLRGWIEARAARTTDRTEAHELRQLGGILDLARTHTPGVRDNGEPAFIHQLWIANAVVSMIDACERQGAAPMRDSATLIKIALCHDLLEDSSLTRPQLRGLIGERAERAVYNMSYKYLGEDGQRIRKDKAVALEDLKSDHFSLILKYFDRSHNFMTMMDVDRGGVLKGIVYTPEKQLEKLQETSLHFIPAGDPVRIIGQFPADHHAYILSARDTLARTASKVVGRFAELDYYRTILVVDNPTQRERIAAAIRLPGQDQVGRTNNATPVTFDDFYQTPPPPSGVFGRLARLLPSRWRPKAPAAAP